MSNSRKYFGTDGIRGKANSFPMTADMALKVAQAAAIVLRGQNQSGAQNKAIIGKDTRLSCYMLEQAMAAGFEAMGMDVILLGPLPTPAVAMLTRSLRADLGVMISASHNPFDDNGIKLFGPDGYKLPDEVELKIEALLDQDLNPHLPPPDLLGRANRLDDAPGRYIEFIKGSFPKGRSLEGIKVVVDCAHGAGYKVAPQILWELEAEVVTIANRPNGRNINGGVGATHPKELQDMVVTEEADIGIALDGDADRLILVDDKGQVVDGDQIIALLATHMQDKGTLRGDTVVTTAMSNLGLERYLLQRGLALARTPVGDRYVVEKMREGNYNLGGEQSGHIVLSDYATTGDGLLAAIHVLSILSEKQKPASEVLHVFEPLPQILQNVRFESGLKPLDNAEVQAAVKKAEGRLVKDGRLLVRASGTEPLIRVMAEGDNSDLVKSVVGDLCAVIEKFAKAS